MSCSRDHGLLQRLIKSSFAARFPLRRRLCLPRIEPTRVHSRGAKNVSRRKVRDLKQGPVGHGPMLAEAEDDTPQYSQLLQGVKNNMIKFDKCVVLTRVGNFYELYFEHAEVYGPLLDLKAASRHTELGPVPMAGFPYWQLDKFLKTLVHDLSKHVAVSEEFPLDVADKLKSGTLQYERRVARVITPGTLIDETFLDSYQNNFILAMHLGESGRIETTELMEPKSDPDLKVGLAWLDLSTGDFFTQQTLYTKLPAILMRIAPREIILPRDIQPSTRQEISDVMGLSPELITLYDTSSQFTSMNQWSHTIEEAIGESDEAYFSGDEKLAGHRLIDYVRTQLLETKFQLRPPQRKDINDILCIDRGSLRGLEILETAKDGLGRGSLFHAVRRTVTRGGSRLLRDRLTAPSTSIHEINGRLDLVAKFLAREMLRENVISCLRGTFDVTRLVQKFAVNRGDADDLLRLARAISETKKIYESLKSDLEPATATANEEDKSLRVLLNKFHLEGPEELSKRILDAIDEVGLIEQHRLEESEDLDVVSFVQTTLLKSAPEELSSLPRKTRTRTRTSSAKAHFEENANPWIMRPKASERLDRLHKDLETLQTEKSDLQGRLQDEFDTSKLELKWTPGLGHICHISSSKTLDDDLIQSLDGRIISSSKSTRSLQIAEWSRLGERLAVSRLKVRDEESRIFRQLRQLTIENLVYLRRNAAALDELDVGASLAALAHEQGWSRPKLTNGTTHKIVGGRHPTVKLGLEEQGRSFVSNDLFLGNGERVWIVTGPNMAGKSTFLRQNALITILAQTGSYVPAEHAELGLVDQIFSRIGAADDLFRNQSTFMVEMLETAAILKQATPRSFVIMDEVGRGTTPEDGTAVSFASLHHLYHTNKCRTLFATHFHALIDMTSDWPEMGRYCTDMAESPSGSFNFVHKLRPGVNRQSHALRVAQMAGLPQSALEIAKLVQEQLLRSKGNSKTEVV